jgi:hypothetical protein
MRLLLLLLLAVPCAAEEIPLSEVLATDIPGTQDFIEAERHLWEKSWGEWYANSRSLRVINALHAECYNAPERGAGSAVILPGSPNEALSHAIALLTDKVPPPPVRAREEHSLFFFAYPLSMSSLDIQSISKTPGLVRLTYAIKTEDSPHSTSPRFALIPLGKASAGELRVDLEHAGPNHFAQFVCKPTTATVLAEKVTIPLSSIFAYRMPHTQSIEGTDFKEAEASSIRTIQDSLNGYGNKDTVFLVTGDIRAAILEAAKVFAGSAEPRELFFPTDFVWAVFYARSGSTYVQVISVADEGKEVQLIFQQTTHSSANSTSHLAFIPIGKRPPGDLRISVREAPAIGEDGLAPKRDRKGRREVSGSATFTVDHQR